MITTTDPRVAAAAIAGGHLAAVPTETVYGLGALASDARAVARIYAVKGRPADHPLIVHVIDAVAFGAWGVQIPTYAHALAATFWPGPMTLVVPRSERAKDFVTGGQDSIAIRVPSHIDMRALLHELAELTNDPAIGVAAPSANRFGRVSPTSAAHVIDEIGELLQGDDVVLDGGDCEVGVESTIIDCTGPNPKMLRPGAITIEDVESATGLKVTHDSTVRASGTLNSHYSPNATVQLITEADIAFEIEGVAQGVIGLLALAEVSTPSGVVRLAAPRNTDEYARALYAALREADALKLEAVLAVPPAATGVGVAVIDRLIRAAAGA